MFRPISTSPCLRTSESVQAFTVGNVFGRIIFSLLPFSCCLGKVHLLCRGGRDEDVKGDTEIFSGIKGGR